MTRSPRFSVALFALAAQIVCAGAPLAAQRARIRTRPMYSARAVFLPDLASGPLAVAPSGVVLVGSTGMSFPYGPALVSIQLDGSSSVLPLDDMRPGETIGSVRALSRDGSLVAGYGLSPNALYFEGMWWDAQAPHAPHGVGGFNSAINGIENTPSGRVLVGWRDDLPFDVRPGGGGNLAGLPPRNKGAATGLSADGSVYCGWVDAHLMESRAVRWVDRVPHALDDPVGTRSEAHGVSSNGANFAGSASTVGGDCPAVWLAEDGLVRRTLRDRDGSAFQGTALRVLDDGFAFGGAGFGWIWHPSSGTDRVTRIEDWLAFWGIHTTPIDSVLDVVATRASYHFSLSSGQHSWYVETPRAP